MLQQTEYDRLRARHRDIAEDAAIGAQAERSMIRIERATRHMAAHGVLPDDCVTCGDPIAPARRRAMPMAIWCTQCVDVYDRRRRKPWMHRRSPTL